MQESINLIAFVVTALFAGFVGKHVARWGLQIYYHLRILDHRRYLVFYDKFQAKSAFELLSKISDSLPGSYDEYLRLHQENRQSACLLYSGYLLVLLARILLVFGLLAGGCFVALGQYYPSWVYLLSVGATLVPVFCGVFRARIRHGRDGGFYRLAVMGVVWERMRRRSIADIDP